VKTATSNLHNRISLKPKKDKIPYEVGVRIMMDTQVSTGFDILKYILSSKQWVLIANENDTVGVFDFINTMLFNMETELQEIVKQSITALPWGFSIHELLFDLNNDGKLIVKNAIPIHIKTLQNNPFTYDENGDLVSIHQEYNGEDVEIPINKVFKYSFNANYDEDAGNGLLYDFIPIVEDKLNINNWLMTFLEKHESPTLYGKTSNPASRDAMLSAFDDIQDGTTGLVVGIEDDVGVLESSHRGETFFKTLQYKDNQIFRRYYLGNLLLGDNSQTGTYAQSQTQLEFGSLVFDGILEEIANCIQKQIINPIVEANYGDITLAPTISFDKFTTGDLTALFNTIKPLIDSGVVDSENPAVQDSIALLIKKETGLNYTNETEPINEEFNLPPDNSQLTETILDDLNGI
jgi:phage gp29-like protein